MSLAIDTGRAAERARQVRFSTSVLRVIAGFFFLIGWMASHIWLGIVFCGVCIAEGWASGRPPGQERGTGL